MSARICRQKLQYLESVTVGAVSCMLDETTLNNIRHAIVVRRRNLIDCEGESRKSSWEQGVTYENINNDNFSYCNHCDFLCAAQSCKPE
jgi:hypothetical protein